MVSSSRQVELAALGRYFMGAGQAFDEHSHARHQVSWACRGRQIVDTDTGRWHVRASEAMWVPGRTMHAITFTEPTEVWLAYFETSDLVPEWSQATAGALLPAFGEIIGGIEVAVGAEARFPAIRRVDLGRLVAPVPTSLDRVPAPSAWPLRAIAEHLADHPDDGRSLADWGRTVGASRRTLERSFLAQLGVPFDEWRRRIRLDAAVGLLADGVPVTRVAHRVGYRSASSFTVAFRREFGHPPSRHFGTSS